MKRVTTTMNAMCMKRVTTAMNAMAYLSFRHHRGRCIDVGIAPEEIYDHVGETALNGHLKRCAPVLERYGMNVSVPFYMDEWLP